MALGSPLLEQPQFGAGQFEALSAFDGLKGLRFAWGSTWGIALPSIDDALANLNRGGFVLPMVSGSVPVNLFDATGQQMLHNIGKGLTATQPAAAHHWIARAQVLDAIGAAVERNAEDVVHTRKVINRKTAPRVIERIVRPNVKAQLRPVAKRAAEAEARAERAERAAAALKARVAKLERQTGVHREGVIVGTPPRVGIGEREAERIRAGLRKVAKYGSLAYFLALLLKALEKMGASWIRCSNVKRFGKRLCGMDASALDALLAGSVLIAGTISIVTLTRAVLAAEDEIVKGIQRAVRELQGLEGVIEGGYHGVSDGLT